LVGDPTLAANMRGAAVGSQGVAEFSPASIRQGACTVGACRLCGIAIKGLDIKKPRAPFSALGVQKQNLQEKSDQADAWLPSLLRELKIIPPKQAAPAISR
jgi:hypothetical protein